MQEKQKQKPSVTKSFKKSVRQRDKIHKKLLKKKDVKTQKQTSYKEFCKLIIEILKKKQATLI